MVKGRNDHYSLYWCWTKGCRKVGVSKDELEGQFLALLKLMEPSAECIAMLPTIAAREWEMRKARISKDAEQLTKELADQTTLNQRTIRAKIEGQISSEEFQTMKETIATETDRIRQQITALDSERSAMEDLIGQEKTPMLDLVAAWKSATTSQKQELVHGFFPKGLPFSEERKFFEPGNTELRAMQLKWLEDHLIKNEPIENIGAGDGI
jgi:DNA-binding FrmR family transcriptional regulator